MHESREDVGCFRAQTTCGELSSRDDYLDYSSLLQQGRAAEFGDIHDTLNKITIHTSRKINTKVLFRDHVVLYLDSIQPPGGLNRTKVCSI
jgi:hypothetical protein